MIDWFAIFVALYLTAGLWMLSNAAKHEDEIREIGLGWWLGCATFFVLASPLMVLWVLADAVANRRHEP